MTIDLPADPPAPHDKFFGITPLPEWVEGFRSFQWDLITAIHEEFKTHDVVLLQAPTGVGKSLTGEVSRRLQQTNGVYTCSSKALQDQFEEDFPYAQVVKGRSNYLTESGPLNQLGAPVTSAAKSVITCADCTWNEKTGACRWCRMKPLCPYIKVRDRAARADLAVLNTSYLLTDLNLGGALFKGRGMVVIDEADLLPREVLDHVSVELSPRRMKELGITRTPTRITKEASWTDWVEFEALPNTSAYLNTLPHISDVTDAHMIRKIQSTQTLLDQLFMVFEELPKGNWVYDGQSTGAVIFRPIYTSKYGRRLLWDHGNRTSGLPTKWLLMSATILSADLLADELGLRSSYGFIDCDSPFPVENRPVHVVPVADMSYRMRETGTWDQMVAGIRGVLALHPDDRVLIHTVSYALARHIKDGLKLDPSPPTSNSRRPIITYESSEGKAHALREYKRQKGAVLIAPSMDRGVDLPGDLCRVQIIAKVPFPNTQDRRTNARMYGKNGRMWYAAETVRTVVQMTGRGIRSADDHATTYILDSQFASNLWRGYQYLFPKYWRDAVNWRFSKSQIVR